jgi:NAD+ synthase
MPSELSLDFDMSKSISICEEFIKEQVKRAAADGVAIGLSGGLDSSLLAALCVRAVGPSTVHGFIMPVRGITPSGDVRDARELSRLLGIEHHHVEISKIVKAFMEADPLERTRTIKTSMARGNVMARIRMTLLYHVANLKNFLVAGSGDRSEILIGYFTKFGDGGADFFPLGNLYKTQVRELAKYLELPSSIVNKPSSPRFWRGHIAENEIGLVYEKVDLILHGLLDLNLQPKKVASEADIPLGDIVKVLKMVQRSEHKRMMPPLPPPIMLM